MENIRSAVIALWVLACCSGNGSAEIEKSTGTAEKLPKMVFEKTTIDFGIVKSGDQVLRKFFFRNEGSGDLIIQQLRPGCGCTALTASSASYRPGEKGEVEIKFDAAGYMGRVGKEAKIIINDPRASIELAIQGTVIGETHPEIKPHDTIFKGLCASCHSSPGAGEKGESLYNAVCYICHDYPQEKGKKQIAPSRKHLASMPINQVLRITSEGILNRSMPAFAQNVGGVLTKEQIDSLMEYIRPMKKKR